MSALRNTFLVLSSVMLLASCGSSGGGDQQASAAAPTEGFKPRSGGMFDDDSKRMMDRWGATNPNMTKKKGESRLGMEAENKEFSGEFARNNKEYKTKEYKTPSFWGTKEYAKKVYEGNTDGSRFKKEARQSGQGANEQGMASREAGKSYKTDTVKTDQAREAGASNYRTGSDAETDARRNVFKQPEVRDYRTKRALTVEDTKDMLGR